MPAGTSLTIDTPAFHIYKDIVFVFAGCYHKGLAHHHRVLPLIKILGKVFSIYDYFSRALAHKDTGYCGFTSTGSNTKVFNHPITSRLQFNCNGILRSMGMLGARINFDI